MRVLIVRLSSFGDVVHAFPAVTDLKAARPDVEVDWLVEEAIAPIVVLHPGVAAIHAIGLRHRRWPPWRWPGLAGEVLGRRAALRARRYDLVVDLQGLMKSAVAARLAGRAVAGYDRESAREPAAAAFYRTRVAVPRSLHAVERGRRLLADAVGYEVPNVPGSFGLVMPPRERLGPDLPERYAIAAHGTSWPTKHWPEQHWQSLLAALAKDGLPLILPWGNEAERERGQRLAAACAGVSVLPRILSGAALAAFVGGADYIVGLDSGLMHLAAALDVPGVWLYGPTDPALSGPYGSGHAVVCSDYAEAPCGRRVCDRRPDGMCCMAAIGPELVVAAVRRPPIPRPSSTASEVSRRI